MVDHVFDLGSKSNVDLDIMVLKGSRNALPSTRDRISNIPGVIGVHDNGGDYGSIRFEIPCKFVGDLTESALQSSIRALTDHLTNVDGKPRELELTFVEEPNKSYTVRYSGDGLNVGRGIGEGRGEFTLDLIAADPRASSAEETVTKNITESPETLSIANEGNVRTPIIIEITNNGSSAVSGIEITKEVTS